MQSDWLLPLHALKPQGNGFSLDVLLTGWVGWVGGRLSVCNLPTTSTRLTVLITSQRWALYRAAEFLTLKHHFHLKHAASRHHPWVWPPAECISEATNRKKTQPGLHLFLILWIHDYWPTTNPFLRSFDVVFSQSKEREQRNGLSYSCHVYLNSLYTFLASGILFVFIIIISLQFVVTDWLNIWGG